MGQLTTHVLDTSAGRPAGGLRIELYRLDPGRELLNEGLTNQDGRPDAPLLDGDAFINGEYELVFHAGDYLDQHGSGERENRFLNLVPIRFVVSDSTEHYHVPLLLSPFGYSTYRGS